MKAAIAVSMIVALATVAVADPTATLVLESPQSGQTVSPGTTIEWTIKVSVSTDTGGLALICADLVQNPANPAKLDIPPGNPGSIDATMQNFNRPLGIANPGEGGADSGYIGVQRGADGEKNLIQAGGAQNTFGQAGDIMGTNPNVISGVGKGTQQVVLSGSFPAPSAAGTYEFSLVNPFANTLQDIVPPPTPPDHWPVDAAEVILIGASFSFDVEPGGACIGDCNCDGIVDLRDINPFAAGLASPETQCDPANFDINEDDLVDLRDINPFVNLLSTGGVPFECP
jgi:hypothetical protein